MHRQIGLIGPVHAQHAQKMLVRCRQRAQSHQRQGGRPARQMRQLCQQLRGVRAGIDDAAAAINDRLFSAHHHIHSGRNGRRVRFGCRLIARCRLLANGLVAIGRILHQDVLWQIDQNRAGAAGTGNVKRLYHSRLQTFAFLDQIIMLCTGAGDASCVRFLKGVIPDQMRWHLACKTDNRHRIHQRIRQTGYRIGGPRA